ncbi:unnamed protein product [Thlaspi arvense]|uniref:DC1 domain-containing protein n=1 Tax=Thlaspi arvense TaxID=13288 RepID=A0AAU9T6U2_THLAR|nr:unnamed protein product [Thlaspi arvense]
MDAHFGDGHKRGYLYSYNYSLCNFYVHEECINVNIPSHHKHPLKFTSARIALIFNQSKAHEDELHQVPIYLSFTCDACVLRSSDHPIPTFGMGENSMGYPKKIKIKKASQ